MTTPAIELPSGMTMGSRSTSVNPDAAYSATPGSVAISGLGAAVQLAPTAPSTAGDHLSTRLVDEARAGLDDHQTRLG